MKKYCTRVLFAGLILFSPLSQGAALGVFDDKVYSTAKLHVKFIDVQGGHLFPEKWLKSVLSEYTNRKLSAKQIAQLQARLTEYYQRMGYVTSGVVVPEQEVTDGVLVMQVVHGRVTLLEQSGGWEMSPAYVQEYFRSNLTVPVNVESLNQSLSMLQEHDLVESASARLEPGSTLGESRLSISLDERRPDFYGVSVDNYQSPSVGAARLGLSAGNRSLMGMRDRVEVGVGASEGLKDYSLKYALPLNNRDLTLQASLQGSEYSIIEEPFNKADLKSSSRHSQVSLLWPVLRKFDRRGEVFVGVDQTRSEISAFNVLEQSMETGALMLGANWRWRSMQHAFASRVHVEQGTSALGSRYDSSQPDGIYKLAGWLAQYRWQVKPMQSLQSRVNAQWVNEAVPATKRFSLGGVNSVRGYRQNRFVRDYGIAASVEWHWQVNKSLEIYPFVDIAEGLSAANDESNLNDQSATQDKSNAVVQPPQGLVSAGLGLGWQRKGFQAGLMWGKPLVSVESVGNDLQDNGVYLGLSYRTR